MLHINESTPLLDRVPSENRETLIVPPQSNAAPYSGEQDEAVQSNMKQAEGKRVTMATSWLKEVSIPAYTLVMLFAVSSWIDINGLWVEVPLLVNELPEKWNLPSYLVILIQIANIGPFVYTIGHKIAPGKVSEVPVVFLIISIGAISILLLVHFWDYTSYVLGTEHSTALLTLTSFLALVDCTSSVVYLPYMQRLKPQYMSALYIGEGLSGLIPGLVGLAQGVGGNPTCENGSSVVVDPTTGINITEWVVYPVYPPPRFSVEVFFWFLFAMMCLSGVAFTLVHYLPYCKRAHVQDSTTPPAGELVLEQNAYEPVKQFDPEASVQASSGESLATHSSDDVMVTPMREKQGSTSTVMSSAVSGKHTCYLLLLTAWICALTNGVLPSTQTYSCLPYGHLAYTLSVRLSTIVNPLACFLVLFLPAITVTGVSILVATASVLAAYLLYLAALSPAPPLQGHVLGVTLVILASVLMTAIFSYVKVCIATMLREVGGHRALLLCGVVTQIGSLCGALVTFIVVNVLHLLQSMNPCSM